MKTLQFLWRTVGMVLAFIGLQVVCLLVAAELPVLFGAADQEILPVELLWTRPALLGAAMLAHAVLTCLLFAGMGWWRPAGMLTVRFDSRVFLWLLPLTLSVAYAVTWLSDRFALPDYAQDTLHAIVSRPVGVLTVTLFVPLCEEVVFRAGLLGYLLRSGFRPCYAISLSAVVFALVHGNPAQLPAALLFGGLLGWLYWRSDCLWPSFVVHAVNNGLAVLSMWLVPSPDVRLADLLGGECPAAVLLVAAFGTGFGVWRRLNLLLASGPFAQDRL